MKSLAWYLTCLGLTPAYDRYLSHLNIKVIFNLVNSLVYRILIDEFQVLPAHNIQRTTKRAIVKNQILS